MAENIFANECCKIYWKILVEFDGILGQLLWKFINQLEDPALRIEAKKDNYLVEIWTTRRRTSSERID